MRRRWCGHPPTLPRSGAPPAFGSYAAWTAFVERLQRAGLPLTDDYRSFWWDVRPHPMYGTLEIRMPDQPTSLERTASFVRVLREMCAWAIGTPQRAFDPAERGIYAQNRWAASRFGPHAKLIHPDRNEALSASDLVRELPVALDGLEPRS